MATKWGVLSAGKISHDFVTAVQSIPEKRQHEFVAVAARNLSSAQVFAENHNIKKAYGSYEQLAKDPNIDVVYVGVTSALHFQVGKLMLENRKHVLMEKPMALNSKQTQALIELAREKKCFLMEALWSRFVPAYKFIMELITEKSIGDVVHVNANLGVKLPSDTSVMTSGVGGGALLDIGIYPVNIMSMCYNHESPEQIKAVGHLNDNGLDVSVCGALLYSKNRTASVQASAIANYPNDIFIIGTKGYIKVPESMHCPTSVETDGKTHSFPLPDTIRPCNYPGSSGLRYEAMEVRECLRRGVTESLIMPLKDSLSMAKVMEEMHHQLGTKLL